MFQVPLPGDAVGVSGIGMVDRATSVLVRVAAVRLGRPEVDARGLVMGVGGSQVSLCGALRGGPFRSTAWSTAAGHSDRRRAVGESSLSRRVGKDSFPRVHAQPARQVMMTLAPAAAARRRMTTT